MAVPEGHEAGLVPNRRRLVADHVCNRQAHRLSSRCKQPAAPHYLIHPRTPPLLSRPAVWVLHMQLGMSLLLCTAKSFMSGQVMSVKAVLAQH